MTTGDMRLQLLHRYNRRTVATVTTITITHYKVAAYWATEAVTSLR